MDNRILKFEGEYLNGEINGTGKEYNEKGYLIYEGEYLNGERFGKGKEYYDNGIIKYEGDIYSNEMQGKGKLYNNKGELIFEGEFYENKKMNGHGKEYLNQDNDDENTDNNNLIKIYEGEYHNGKKNGKGKIFNAKGQIFSEGIFLNDNLYEGIIKAYSEKGKLEKESEIKNEKLNGKVNISSNNSEFKGEYLNGLKWNGIIKEHNNYYSVEGEYKNFKLNLLGKLRERIEKVNFLKIYI